MSSLVFAHIRVEVLTVGTHDQNEVQLQAERDHKAETETRVHRVLQLFFTLLNIRLKVIACPLCNQLFQYLVLLLLQSRNRHVQIEQEDQYLLQCKSCGKVFPFLLSVVEGHNQEKKRSDTVDHESEWLQTIDLLQK